MHVTPHQLEEISRNFVCEERLSNSFKNRTHIVICLVLSERTAGDLQIHTIFSINGAALQIEVPAPSHTAESSSSERILRNSRLNGKQPLTVYFGLVALLLIKELA